MKETYVTITETYVTIHNFKQLQNFKHVCCASNSELLANSNENTSFILAQIA